jgi:epoxyqueuosine reductase
MNEIAQLIHQKALELGYEKCGIIPVRKMGGYEEKLDERIQKVPESGVFYKGQQRLVKFKEEFPWAKSVVVLTAPYSKYKVPESVHGHIAKKYLLDIRIDENTKEYQNSVALEEYIWELGLRTATNRKFGIVGLRWAAMQAGLGIIRRNNFFYTESGSWINIEAFLTDREMELIETMNLPSCPKNCDRCIKACPTTSLCEAYTMNPLKCVSFLTTFGGRDLQKEPLAPQFGDWIYGCDVCQDVCPMNHKKWVGNEDFPKLTELTDVLTAESILRMDEKTYKEKIQPKFFYLTPDDLWKWQVNALNYLDNSFDEKYKPAIMEACGSSYQKVRDMAAAICQKRKLR